jgi:hypothetical protein
MSDEECTHIRKDAKPLYLPLNNTMFFYIIIISMFDITKEKS